MARKELTRNAMKIADLIRSRNAERTDKEIADRIGVDPATLCRFKAEHLDKFCAYLDELGLVVKVRDEEDEVQKSLLTLASLAIEGMKK